MITTTEHIQECPNCHHNELTKDYKREETYCNNCGLVITNAFPYVGLEKVENIIPHSAPAEARTGVHMLYVHKDMKGKLSHITGYTHDIPDKKLMIKGHK